MRQPFDINSADFFSVLEACHSRIQEIKAEDSKRHMMDVDIDHNWIGYVEEELLPTLERCIYWQPSDEEINAPLYA